MKEERQRSPPRGRPNAPEPGSWPGKFESLFMARCSRGLGRRTCRLGVVSGPASERAKPTSFFPSQPIPDLFSFRRRAGPDSQRLAYRIAQASLADKILNWCLAWRWANWASESGPATLRDLMSISIHPSGSPRNVLYLSATITSSFQAIRCTVPSIAPPPSCRESGAQR